MTSATRIRVTQSPIHGRGVFAYKRIPKGAPIGDFQGRETKRNGMHVLWVQRGDGSEVGIRGENELRFLNHSARPNAEFRGATLYALRNIQPSREVTIDYGDDWAE